MVSQIATGAAIVVLLVCVVAFSVQSYQHFDPAATSRGNTMIRVLTVGMTLCLVCVSVFTWPASVFQAGVSGGLGCASLILFSRSIRATDSGVLHVAFTGAGPDRLITSGVYGRIRNPLYTSYLLYWAGWMPLTGFHLLSVAGFGVFCVVYVMAARSEETYLSETFGQRYAEFCASTGRFLPKLR